MPKRDAPAEAGIAQRGLGQQMQHMHQIARPVESAHVHVQMPMSRAPVPDDVHVGAWRRATAGPQRDQQVGQPWIAHAGIDQRKAHGLRFDTAQQRCHGGARRLAREQTHLGEIGPPGGAILGGQLRQQPGEPARQGLHVGFAHHDEQRASRGRFHPGMGHRRQAPGHQHFMQGRALCRWTPVGCAFRRQVHSRHCSTA